MTAPLLKATASLVGACALPSAFAACNVGTSIAGAAQGGHRAIDERDPVASGFNRLAGPRAGHACRDDTDARRHGANSRRRPTSMSWSIPSQAT